MVLRSHTITKKKETHNQTWEWEETSEVLAAIEQLHKSSELVESIKVPTLHVGTQNYAKGKKDDRVGLE